MCKTPRSTTRNQESSLKHALAPDACRSAAAPVGSNPLRMPRLQAELCTELDKYGIQTSFTDRCAHGGVGRVINLFIKYTAIAMNEHALVLGSGEEQYQGSVYLRRAHRGAGRGP